MIIELLGPYRQPDNIILHHNFRQDELSTLYHRDYFAILTY